MERVISGGHFLTVYFIENKDTEGVLDSDKLGWADILDSLSITNLKSLSLTTKVAKTIMYYEEREDHHVGLVYIDVKFIKDKNNQSYYHTGKGSLEKRLMSVIIHECTHITNKYALLSGATNELENIANLNAYLTLKAFDYYGVKI